MSQQTLTQWSKPFKSAAKKNPEISHLEKVSLNPKTGRYVSIYSIILFMLKDLTDARDSGSVDQMQAFCKDARSFLESKGLVTFEPSDDEKYFRSKEGMISFMKIVQEILFRLLWDSQFN
jgi:hypothetical protein